MRSKKNTNSNSKIRIAVVGLGKIGSQFDKGKKNRGIYKTHIGNILSNPKFELVGVCDKDQRLIDLFYQDWKQFHIPGLKSLNQLLQKTRPQALVVSTNTQSHFKNLKLALKYRTKLIFCEKPFCASLKQAEQIQNRAKKLSIPILVNYHRRWDERFRSLKNSFDKKKDVLTVTVTYKKGLLNNGSHALDLLLYFFGEPKKIYSPNQVKVGDFSRCFYLEFKNGIVAQFVGVHSAKYELLEIEFYCLKRKIHFEFGGHKIHEYKIHKDRWFKQYSGLEEKPKILHNKPIQGFQQAYSEIAKYFKNSRTLLRGKSEGATQIHRIIRDILK